MGKGAEGKAVRSFDELICLASIVFRISSGFNSDKTFYCYHHFRVVRTKLLLTPRALHCFILAVFHVKSFLENHTKSSEFRLTRDSSSRLS